MNAAGSSSAIRTDAATCVAGTLEYAVEIQAGSGIVREVADQAVESTLQSSGAAENGVRAKPQRDDKALHWDAGHVASVRGREAAVALLTEAARQAGAALELNGGGAAGQDPPKQQHNAQAEETTSGADAGRQRLRGTLHADGLCLSDKPVAWLRAQGVLVWESRPGHQWAGASSSFGGVSKNEARRLAKAERSRDPAVREARRKRRSANQQQQQQQTAKARAKAMVPNGAEPRNKAASPAGPMADPAVQAILSVASGLPVSTITPLPCSPAGLSVRLVAPYVHVHSCAVKQRWVGLTLAEMFEREFEAVFPIEYYRAAVLEGLIGVDGSPPPGGLDHVLTDGQVVTHLALRHEPLVFISRGTERLKLTWHGDVGVLEKPAGIPVHPAGSYNINSVAGMLRELDGAEHGGSAGEPNPLEGVDGMIRFPHRLDAVTSGVLMVAATREAAARIAAQLGPDGSATKAYAARVKGKFVDSFPSGFASCDGRIRSMRHTSTTGDCHIDGKPAYTEFRHVCYCAEDDTSVVEATPTTGRRHQIRIHLQHLGHPIANDPLYSLGPGDGSNGSADRNKEPAEERSDGTAVPLSKGEGALGVTDPDASEAVTMQWDWEREAVKELMTRVASSGDAAAISLLARLIRVDMCLSMGPRAAFCERQLRCSGIWLHAYRYSADGKHFKAPLPAWAVPDSPGWKAAGNDNNCRETAEPLPHSAATAVPLFDGGMMASLTPPSKHNGRPLEADPSKPLPTLTVVHTRGQLPF